MTTTRTFKAKIEVADAEGMIVACGYLVASDQPAGGPDRLIVHGDATAMRLALTQVTASPFLHE